MFLRKINWLSVKDMITALSQHVFRHARNVYSIQLMATCIQKAHPKNRIVFRTH